nr:MAG TPA: hypothetical protein [Caudoviricetes sp.]
MHRCNHKDIKRPDFFMVFFLYIKLPGMTRH